MLTYLILAHRNLRQLVRLSRALAVNSECELLVHIDAATDLRPYAAEMACLRRDGVRMVDRHRCPWGGFGLVEATLAGMAQALREFPSLSHLVVISGQDYPITPPDQIADFYRRHQGLSFMEFHRLPRADWPEGGLRRVGDLHLHWRGRRIGVPLSSIGLPRSVPGGRRPYQGGQTWSMSAECVRHVCEAVAAESGYVRFFRRTAHADESFFQTLVLNSPLADAVVNDDKRFENWSAGGPHPAVLTSRDLPELAASPAHFAKKFDVLVDERVLSLIDEQLLRAGREKAPR